MAHTLCLPASQVDKQIMSLLSRGSNDHEMIGAIGRSGETMARSAGATTLAQPLPGSEGAGTITIAAQQCPPLKSRLTKLFERCRT